MSLYSELKKELASANKKKKLKNIIHDILHEIQHLPQYLSDEEKLFWFSTNLVEHPLCSHPNCNNRAKWAGFSTGYQQHCSIKCARSNPIILQQRKETNLKKFGVEYPSQSSSILEQTKRIWIKTYGRDNPMKTEKVKKNYKNSIITKYNTDNISKSNIVKEKKKITLNSLYKCSSPFQINPDKVKEVWLKKHNVDNPLKSEKIKQKMSMTKKRNNFDKLFHNEIVPLFNFEEYIINERSNWKCTKCNSVILAKIPYVYCNNCDKTNTRSNWELSFINWLKMLRFDNIISNNRQIIPPFEIDIFIPERNIAFELNGVKWHTELMGKDRHYHKIKTDLCREKNIQLFHIFDIEWNSKRSIVKSRIQSKLGIYKEIIGARNCQIKTVNTKEKTNFLSNNHLQGSCPSSVNIGLYFHNELIGIMCLGESRFSKNHQWELLRLCYRVGYQITGGTKKMWSHFIKFYTPDSCISYFDCRWGDSNVYSQLKFTHLKNSSPNYFYTKNGFTLENRIKYQKHKLLNILPTFNNDLTEWENMQQNGYDRIWDCGNEVWVWRYKC